MSDSALDQARQIVKAYKAVTLPDELVPDVIADLQAAERELAEYRRTLLAEAPGPIEGEGWKLAVKRKSTRSYNESKLLVDLADDGEDLAQTLRRLLDNGVVKLTWGWRNLQREADRQNLSLVIAKHEIGDGDEAHVGEVWEEGLEPKPIR